MACAEVPGGGGRWQPHERDSTQASARRGVPSTIEPRRRHTCCSAPTGSNVTKSDFILIDSDTGVDDALAIMLSLHAPSLNVIGITTVSGNTSSQQAALNILFLLRRLGVSGIPVVAGAARSLTG